MTEQKKALHIEESNVSSEVDPEEVEPPTMQKKFTEWINEAVWPGLGLFGESYLLFSIGTLKPVWTLLFPECFEGNLCSDRLLHSLTYSVVLGVISGMLLLGYLANYIGRRKGSITTATFMAGGSLGLTAVSVFLVNNSVALFRSMSIFLFLFGVGIGGEYPLAASSASEKAMGEIRQKLRQEMLEEQMNDGLYVILEKDGQKEEEQPPHRGRKVQLVFTMQGMGIFCNSLTITALLLITGQVRGDQYDETALLNIWRITYAIGAAVLAYVLVSRIQYLQESTVWQDDKERREQLARNAMEHDDDHNMEQPYVISSTRSHASHGTSVSSLSAPSVVADDDDEAMLRHVPSTDPEDDLKSNETSLLLRNYGVRLWGASLSWMLWDVAFYGNKLFQSEFLLALTGDETTLLEFALAATLNSGVALMGYFGAAAILDHPSIGRRRLQQWGFLVTGTLFIACGFFFDSLTSAALVAMYLGTSFFGQLGPNATTFLIPAEIFPTEMRTFCHGISAASGKVGALMAAVMFNHVSDLEMFLLSGYASFAACAVTFWTIPDTTGLDLYETDRKWRMILDGRKGEYSGPANHPKFLSYYERNKLSLQQRAGNFSALDIET